MNRNDARRIMQGKTKGMVNGFICPNLHIVITKNMDDGFLPERIGCPMCNQESVTLMYNVNQDFKHSVEYFRPTEEQTQAACLSLTPKQIESHRHYLKRGGLVSRKAELPPLKDQPTNEGT